MTDEDLLKRARDMCFWDKKEAEIVHDLIALAERRGELLVEERANDIQGGYLSHLKDKKEQEAYREQAREELAVQKHSRLTAAEKDAIGYAIEILPENKKRICDAKDVLRRMLEE